MTNLLDFAMMNTIFFYDMALIIAFIIDKTAQEIK
jgi:hypothetical protein